MTPPAKTGAVRLAIERGLKRCGGRAPWTMRERVDAVLDELEAGDLLAWPRVRAAHRVDHDAAVSAFRYRSEHA